MANKKNLLVSFSGGETSGFMAQWISKHFEDKYDSIVYVFANTGQENEETLDFVQRCDEYWKLNVQWVEASVFQFERKSSGYWLTDFDNAKRKGEPFEAVIQKYGIPNQAFPHCTRELKQNPIKAFAKDWFDGQPYETAIGIRIDEADRMNAKAKENGFIYPLIDKNMIPATKPMINFFWRNMGWRLNLKGYQGNCITCWKKSDKKLYQIYKENPTAFDFMDRAERKYPRIGAEFASEGKPYQIINNEHVVSFGKYSVGELLPKSTGDYENNDEEIIIDIPITKVENKIWHPTDRKFFRKNRSATDIMCEAESWNGTIKDDADEYTYQLDLLGGESCEVFSECS